LMEQFSEITTSSDRISRFLVRQSLEMEKIDALLTGTTEMCKSLTAQTQTIASTVSDLRATMPGNIDIGEQSGFKEHLHEMNHYAKLLTSSATFLAESSESNSEAPPSAQPEPELNLELPLAS
jgi:hypothetical protein